MYIKWINQEMRKHTSISVHNGAKCLYKKEGYSTSKIRDIISHQKPPNIYNIYAIKIKSQR